RDDFLVGQRRDAFAGELLRRQRGSVVVRVHDSSSATPWTGDRSRALLVGEISPLVGRLTPEATRGRGTERVVVDRDGPRSATLPDRSALLGERREALQHVLRAVEPVHRGQGPAGDLVQHLLERRTLRGPGDLLDRGEDQ